MTITLGPDLPDLNFGIAFDNDPSDLAPTYVDLSSRVRGFATRWGRNTELEKFEAGTMDVILDNLDRELDPTNASSTFFGKLVPLKPVRLEALNLPGVASVHAVFYGFVESYDPDWDGDFDSTVRVRCVDAFGLLNSPTLRGNHPATVEGTENASISCYYRCGEPSGTFLENSGRTAAGGPVSALAGQDALITDDFCAAVPLNGAEHARINLADNPTGNDTFSAQIWFRLDKNALSVGRNHVLFEKGDGEPRVYVEEQSSGPNSGRIVFQMRNVGSNTIAVSDSDIIVEETWYHVVVTQTGLSTAVIYVNSVDVTTGTVTPLAVTGTMGLMTLGNSRGGFFDERLGGRVDEFAYWEGVALTQAQVTALYQSVASDRFPAQTTAARIIEVLDQIGLASDARDISVTPQTTLAQHDASDGENTLGHLQDVGLSENGQFCVAADGRVTFQARHERIKVTTVLSTFGDGQNALSDAIADWGVGGSNTIAVSADIDSPPGFTEVWKCTDVAGSGDTNTGLDIGDVTSAGPITALTWVYVPSSYSASMPTVNIASQVSPVFATAQDIRDEWQLVTAIDDHQDDTNLSITLRHGSGGRQAGDFFYVAAAPQLGPRPTSFPTATSRHSTTSRACSRRSSSRSPTARRSRQPTRPARSSGARSR